MNNNERDWPEDFSHENGTYTNQCVSCKHGFIGNKHRSTCKKCAMSNPRTPSPVPNEHSQEGTLDGKLVQKVADAIIKSQRNYADKENFAGLLLDNPTGAAKAAIQAYLAATPKPQPVGWQRMKKAPRDGTKILWRSALSGDMHVVYYPTYKECFNKTSEDLWQPLPAPPALNSEGE